MSLYFEALLLFIFCGFLYPFEQFDAIHILSLLLLFSIFCIESIISRKDILKKVGILPLLICLCIPDLSLFLPFLCYIFFYRKIYLLPALSLIPLLHYSCQQPFLVSLKILLLGGLSFYFANQKQKRDELEHTLKSLRDNSVEQEIILRNNNLQLLENQNNQVYIATLKERNRIAREIHDNVGHMLSRSILQVGALLAICQEENLKPHLEQLKTSLDSAMNSIRNSVHDMHDESIDLTHALQEIIDQFTFCPAKFQCEISCHIPKEVKYCFIAMTKEALNNVVRHSNATKVSIIVKEHTGFYQILIEDNGTPSALNTNTKGIGLNSMEERIKALHGILHISNEHGFRIFASVPK